MTAVLILVFVDTRGETKKEIREKEVNAAVLILVFVDTRGEETVKFFKRLGGSGLNPSFRGYARREAFLQFAVSQLSICFVLSLSHQF